MQEERKKNVEINGDTKKKSADVAAMFRLLLEKSA